MKTSLKLLWYYIETRYTKLLNLFNIPHNPNFIPRGVYCYEIDAGMNINIPKDKGYWVKVCKYYRTSSRTKGIACTYTGYYGFDLYDSCKVCGVNDDTANNEEQKIKNAGRRII
jgi:hypothetical protein